MYAQLYEMMGPEFIRQTLTELDTLFVSDARQLVQILASGERVIGFPLGAVSVDLGRAEDDGLPVGLVRGGMAEGNRVSTGGWDVIAVFNQAPNPNAAKLFVNWWLSREGQMAVQQTNGRPSLRMDIPRDGVLEEHLQGDDFEVVDFTGHPDLTQLTSEAMNFVMQVMQER